MDGLLVIIKEFRHFLIVWLLFCPLVLHASFIESTIGAAVINDATATYFNPSALTLLKKSQIIGLGSIAQSRNEFSGKTIQARTGFTQSGSATTTTNYFLPSFYWGKPLSDKITFGLALVANSFNRNIEEHSILRYDQSSNRVQSVDLIPAAGFKINEYFSLGAAINLTYADFLLQPTSGFPDLNIPDSQSHNESKATGLGGDIGILFKPDQSTTMGFNYRSAITYRFSGTSVLDGSTAVISSNYTFRFWTPARSIFSINYMLTPKSGLIGTVQYLQWDIFKNINIHGIATQLGAQSAIIDATVPYYLHNSWLLTLGNHYRISDKWLIRFAATYSQSPGNPRAQLTMGDSIVAGASTSYELSKKMTIDASYAHAFIRNQDIHIASTKSLIDGVNKGLRDSVSLKLTFNLE